MGMNAAHEATKQITVNPIPALALMSVEELRSTLEIARYRHTSPAGYVALKSALAGRGAMRLSDLIK